MSTVTQASPPHRTARCKWAEAALPTGRGTAEGGGLDGFKQDTRAGRARQQGQQPQGRLPHGATGLLFHVCSSFSFSSLSSCILLWDSFSFSRKSRIPAKLTRSLKTHSSSRTKQRSQPSPHRHTCWPPMLVQQCPWSPVFGAQADTSRNFGHMPSLFLLLQVSFLKGPCTPLTLLLET